MDKTFGKKINEVEYYDRPGAYLIAIKDNLVITVKNPKGYFLLGGGIESGENHEECIKRECIEEIGYEVKVKGFICSADIYKLHEKFGYFHPIQYYYYGEVLSKITEPTEPDHTIEWISFDDIYNKMSLRPQAWAIKQCLKSLKMK